MEEQNAKSITNETLTNEELVSKFAWSMRNSNMKTQIIAAVVLLIVGFLLGGVYAAAMCIMVVLILILYFALGRFRAKRFAAQLMASIRTSYHADSFMNEMVIDDQKIRMKTSNSEKEFLHSDIKTFRETKDMYSIIYNGNLFVLIDKNGFSEGGAEQFRSLVGR